MVSYNQVCFIALVLVTGCDSREASSGSAPINHMYCRTDITDHSCYKTESVCSRRNAFVCKTQRNVYCTAFPGVATVALINRSGEKVIVQGSEKVRDAILSGEYALDPNEKYTVMSEGKPVEVDAEGLTRNIAANTDFEIIENRIFCVDNNGHQSEHIGKDFGWAKTNRNELDTFCRSRQNSDACR